MTLEKPYRDVPGTTIFDAEQSAKGYHLNQFCMSLMTPENRGRFVADQRAYLDEWELSEEQKQALLAVLRRRAASVDDRREFIAPIEDVSCLIGPLVAVDYKVQILRDLDTGIVYLSIEGESAFADEAPLYPATEQEGALLLSIAENQYVEPSTTTI